MEGGKVKVKEGLFAHPNGKGEDGYKGGGSRGQGVLRGRKKGREKNQPMSGERYKGEQKVQLRISGGGERGDKKSGERYRTIYVRGLLIREKRGQLKKEGALLLPQGTWASMLTAENDGMKEVEERKRGRGVTFRGDLPV